MSVPNPIMTSSMRKNNVRKTKTDKVYTLVIAKTLMIQDSHRFSTLEVLDYIELKEFGRFRQKTIKLRTHLKIQLTSYVAQAFPELQYFFKSGLHQKAVHARLKEAPMPKDIASLHLTHLLQSPCEILPWTLHERYGQRIKSSRTEVCRLK